MFQMQYTWQSQINSSSKTQKFQLKILCVRNPHQKKQSDLQNGLAFCICVGAHKYYLNSKISVIVELELQIDLITKSGLRMFLQDSLPKVQAEAAASSAQARQQQLAAQTERTTFFVSVSTLWVFEQKLATFGIYEILGQQQTCCLQANNKQRGNRDKKCSKTLILSSSCQHHHHHLRIDPKLFNSYSCENLNMKRGNKINYLTLVLNGNQLLKNAKYPRI